MKATGGRVTVVDREVAGGCPLDCPDACSWIVGVRDGVAVTLRGRPEHPFTHGTLCVKVNQYLDHAASPDRLRHALRRSGPKGTGRFTRISLDSAFDEIAERFNRVRHEYGGESIWPYQGTGNLGYLQGLQGQAGARLWNVLGASEHDMTICSAAGLVGADLATGTHRGIDPESLAHSRLILLWGVNTLTTSHHQWRFINKAREQGAHVVAIDPVATRTAQQADEHLAPRPGTDAALALGLLNVVVAAGGADRGYLADHTLGWPEFHARIEQFPPERTAELTGVSRAQIEQLGERIATTRPTGIRAGSGMQRHAGGGAAVRVLACLPGVTGDWGRLGGGLTYSTDGYFGGNREALLGSDLRAAPVRRLSMTRLGQNLLDLTPPVKALFVYGANPVVSNPDQQRVRQGLAREDLFTVVVDHFQTDTADYADIVLPATMQTEHLDVLDGYGHMYLAWNEPATVPPGDCLSTTETFRRIARHMGLSEPRLYDSDQEMAAQLLASDHPSLDGIDVESLRRDGWVRLSYPADFVPFADGFPTPSGKLEFRSERAVEAGFEAVAGYTPPRESTDPELAARYPLSLIAGASHFFLNSVFANKPELRRRAGPPRVELHPDDMAARGLTDGTPVVVFNDRGSFVSTAHASAHVRSGVVATTKGHWMKLTGGSTVNATVNERDADMGGGAVFHDNRVEVEEWQPSAARD
ncbi:Dimethylsulfoxide reductase [Micromonospora noduli]|uniref:molybdopterin-containing oxidoreductase family protein n=1 Tax=Micromonospora noduli TaxID=709876 RepID=UPI000DC4C11D|nr:molybdopterin-dependent oxidoreductase [Micromonospora noduli]RAO53822.1 Dimethylsulfoxide reductase [Micromonospora noduli]